MCFLFKHNSDGYCRNARLSTVDGNEIIINQDSIKFQIGNSNDCENGDMNTIDMEPEEIRVIFIWFIYVFFYLSFSFLFFINVLFNNLIYINFEILFIITTTTTKKILSLSFEYT